MITTVIYDQPLKYDFRTTNIYVGADFSKLVVGYDLGTFFAWELIHCYIYENLTVFLSRNSAAATNSFSKVLQQKIKSAFYLQESTSNLSGILMSAILIPTVGNF
jgi:hypothetical protein